MKERTRKYVRLSLILYVALLSAAVIATAAWFITSRTASIKTSEDMVITAGQQLEISMTDSSAGWGSTVGVPVPEMAIPDITGNGVNFYFPTTLDSNDMPIMSDASTFMDVSDNPDGEYYIEYKVSFRTAAQTKVYLSNQSSIIPKDLDSADDLTGTVSKDILAGAVRVAFLEEVNEGEYVTRAIWIPNDGYQISKTGDGYTFVKDGHREDSYGYLSVGNDQVTSHAWGTDDFRTGKVIVGTTALASSAKTDEDGNQISAMTNGGAPLLTFDGGTEKTEKTLVIRIWLEGTDREAVTDLVGGQFSYKLDFISISKTDGDNTLGAVTWSETENKLNGVEGKNVLYSFNAIDWMPYSNQIEGSDGYDVIYVREKETATKICGAVNAIPRSSAAQ